MEIYQAINNLRRAKENNELVIFVGAGVSKNSGLPDWKELIKQFSEKINYDKCGWCKFKDKGVCSEHCEEKTNFSQEEYLKIPQYFYNQDKSENNIDYFNIISKNINTNVEANDIDDLILKIFPKHIITTNYDHLLEKSFDYHSMLYQVITKDEDLLVKHSQNYIIKMHGDIDDIHSIILKEDDYLNYSQTHIVIETYIKSLLLNNTFLFVGYSLNDNNLKMIFSWIDHIAKEKNAGDHLKKHYIISNVLEDENYLMDYYNKRNIDVIDPKCIDENYIRKYKGSLKANLGKRLYWILERIVDDKYDKVMQPLKERLYENLLPLGKLNAIPYSTLLQNLEFENTEFDEYGNLIYKNREEFEEIKLILNSNDSKSKFIKNILSKSCIKNISDQSDDDEKNSIEVKEIYNLKDTKYYHLYLNYEYDKVIDAIKFENNDIAAFYYHLLLPESDYAINKLNEVDLEKKCTINLYFEIVHKYNKFLTYKKKYYNEDIITWKELNEIYDRISQKEKAAYKYLNNIINGLDKKIITMKKLLEDHEKYYVNHNETIYIFPNVNGKIYHLQLRAYEYYNFINFNHIMIRGFKDPKDYLRPYIQAIFCTYYPSNKIEFLCNSEFAEDNYERKNYIINEIDLDIIIHFSDINDIDKWINKYKVKKLETNFLQNITFKFKNLCSTLKKYKTNRLLDDYMIFIRILTLVDIKECADVLKEIYFVLKEWVETDRRLDLVLNVVAVYGLAIKDKKISYGENILDLLFVIFEEEEKYKNVLNKSRLNICFTLFSKYSDQIEFKIDVNIKKLEQLFTIRKVIYKWKRKELSELINSNIEKLDSKTIMYYVKDNIIKFDDTVKNIVKNEIVNTLELRKKTGEIAIPGSVVLITKLCCDLYLSEKISDIDFLSNLKKEEKHIEFLLDQECFDYSNVDLRENLWVKIFSKEIYRDLMLRHKKEILTDDLLQDIKNGYVTERTKRIVYHYFFDEGDIF